MKNTILMAFGLFVCILVGCGNVHKPTPAELVAGYEKKANESEQSAARIETSLKDYVKTKNDGFATAQAFIDLTLSAQKNGRIVKTTPEFLEKQLAKDREQFEKDRGAKEKQILSFRNEAADYHKFAADLRRIHNLPAK